MPFSVDDAKKIIKATREPFQGCSPNELADALNDVELNYNVYRDTYDKPLTDKQRKDGLNKITTNADNLLKALGFYQPDDNKNTPQQLLSSLFSAAERFAEENGPYRDLKPLQNELKNFDTGETEIITDYQPEKAVWMAVEGVLRLKQWASTDVEHMEQDDWRPWGPQGLSAEAWLIREELPKVYKGFTGQCLGYSTDPYSKERVGPGVRFIESCLIKLGIPKTPEAIVCQLKERGKSLGGKQVQK